MLFLNGISLSGRLKPAADAGENTHQEDDHQTPAVEVVGDDVQERKVGINTVDGQGHTQVIVSLDLEHYRSPFTLHLAAKLRNTHITALRVPIPPLKSL